MGNSFSENVVEEATLTAESKTTRGSTKQTFEFNWTLDHFSFSVWQFLNCLSPLGLVEKMGLVSPTFSTGEHKWHVCYYIEEITYPNESTHEFLSFFLVPDPTSKKPVFAGYKIGILNADGVKTDVVIREPEFIEIKTGITQTLDLIRKDDLLNEENHYLSDNSLKFFCEIDIFSDHELLSCPTLNSSTEALPECHLTSNFEDFLQSGDLSDVTLAVGEKEFKSHKVILAAASPVFAAMFEHDMKEKQENRVDIKDVDLPVFEDFLHFIYTGKVDNLEENAEDLLAVAERYGVERLKAICEEFIASQLTVENVAQFYGFAYLHNANQLKVITSEFLKKNILEISKSDSFQSLFEDIHIPHPRCIWSTNASR